MSIDASPDGATLLDGLHCRLPSEAEWVRASRAGSDCGCSWGGGLTHEHANCGRDRWAFTAPAARFPANAFGLHDDQDNECEWLEDCYHENHERASADGSARRADCSLADWRILRGAGEFNGGT